MNPFGRCRNITLGKAGRHTDTRLEKLPERQLAARIAQGDPRAFALFVDRYGGRIQALARRSAASEPDAQDLTQEILIALYKSLGNFRGDSALSTWTYRVAMNHCLKHRARTQPASLPYDEALGLRGDETQGPARSALRRELSDRLETALTRLSQDHQDTVVLHELHGLTYGECAVALNVPVGTVKSRLSNAFRRLREHLSGYVLGEEPCSCPAPETST